MKKGYVLTLDAVLALMFVIALLLYTVGVGTNNSIQNTERTDFKRLHYVSEDAIEVMNKKGVLDDIGTEWANAGGNKSSPHWSNASNMTELYLRQIIPERMGYKLMIGNDTLYQHNISTREADASVETRSARVLTGYASGKPVIGYVSRAYLSGIESERNTILTGWQRTVSPGNESNILNLTSRFTLPSDFTCNSVYLQAVPRSVPSENFTIWINNQVVTNGPMGKGGGISEFGEYNEEIDCDFLNPGTNTMKFKVWDTQNVYEIGKGSGTRMLIDYNTSEMGFNASNRFYLDAAESACPIVQQISLLMPGTINSLTIHFEGAWQTTNKVELGLVYQGVVYELGDYPFVGTSIDIDNATLATALKNSGAAITSYKLLENETFSFLFYLDTDHLAYDPANKLPDCGNPAPREVYSNSYIDVDYKPFPRGTDLYGYNMITESMNFTSSGSTCSAGYTSELNSSFTLPAKALPWTVDTWLAWMYSSADPSVLNETISSNGVYLMYLIENPDLFLTSYGFTGSKPGSIQPGAINNLSATGTYAPNPSGGYYQLCFNETLTGGTNTYLYRAFVDYGDPFKYSDGCDFNVTFEDDSFIKIPMSSSESCGNDTDDSVTDAMNRLLAELDSNSNNKSDIKFDASQLTMESTVQARIRSMWGPVLFKVVVWI